MLLQKLVSYRVLSAGSCLNLYVICTLFVTALGVTRLHERKLINCSAKLLLEHSKRHIKSDLGPKYSKVTNR